MTGNYIHPDWNLSIATPTEVTIVEQRGLLIQPPMNLQLELEKNEPQNSESQSGIDNSGSQQSVQKSAEVAQKPGGEKSETQKPAEGSQKSGNAQQTQAHKFHEFWGYTYVVREKFVISWKLLNFKNFVENLTTGDPVISEPYYLPNADTPHVIVTLHCYPKGHSETYEGKFGLFFHLRATHLEDLFIPLEFAVIPGITDRMVKLEKTISKASPQRLKFDLNDPRSKPKKSWGCADFFILQTILDESDIYMPNGDLDIEVSGAIRGQYNRSGVAGERGSNEVFLNDISRLRHPENIPGAEFDIKLLTVDKKEFYAHRVILATASETMQILFTEAGKDLREFIVGDYSPEVLQAFIYYAYENQTFPNMGGFGKLKKLTLLSEIIQFSKIYSADRLYGLCNLELINEVGPEVCNELISALEGKKSRLEVTQCATAIFQKKFYSAPQFVDNTDDDLYQ